MDSKFKFYDVNVSIKIMAENEEEAQMAGYDWIRESDIECFQVIKIREVDETIEWLAQVDALLSRSFNSWHERYGVLRRLYMRAWNTSISPDEWGVIMEALERHGETILEWRRV